MREHRVFGHVYSGRCIASRTPSGQVAGVGVGTLQLIERQEVNSLRGGLLALREPSPGGRRSKCAD